MKLYGMKLMVIGTILGVIAFGITCIEGVQGTGWSTFASGMTMVALVVFLIGAVRKNHKE